MKTNQTNHMKLQDKVDEFIIDLGDDLYDVVERFIDTAITFITRKHINEEVRSSYRPYAAY